jgi:hypothetical protein
MRSVLWMVTVLLALGCSSKAKPTADPKFDDYVKATKDKLGKLDKIKAAVATAAPITEDKLEPAATKGNWTILATDQLDKLEACFSDAKICGPEWTLLKSCQDDAKKTAQEVAEQYGGAQNLKACSELTLLAVVRKVSFTKPTADMKTKTYSPGEFVGEVLVYEIDSAKYLGGFRVTSKTPDSLDKVLQSADVDDSLLQTIKQGFIQGVKLKLGDPRRG